MLFGFYGISHILYVSMGCFLVSAIMEMFIVIPFEKKEVVGNIFSIGLADLKESFLYMKYKQPLIMQFSLVIAAINMILSALMIIGLPVIVTQLLTFDSETANRLYGYAQGALAMVLRLLFICTKKESEVQVYERILECDSDGVHCGGRMARIFSGRL